MTLIRSILASDPAKRPQSAKELLVRLRQCREAIEARPRRRRLLQLAALVFLTISGLGLTSYFWYRQHFQERGSSTTLTAPEKSIAVLPFENLSNDNEDAVFADGVQDDILTKLAKVRDLKGSAAPADAHVNRSMRDYVALEYLTRPGSACAEHSSLERAVN